MIRTEVETIDAAKAIEYLKKNTGNYRKLSMQKVYQYAEDMKRGLWELNGETIVFDENGTLKDGQHRLAAIAKANIPVKINVARGVDPSIKLYDVGQARTAKQILAANDFDATGALIGAASLLIDQVYNTSRPRAIDYCMKHRDELRRAENTTKNGDKSTARKSACVLAAYLMLRTREMPYYEVELFYRVMSTGDRACTDGYEVSPAMVARKMFQDRSGPGGRKVQREQLEICMLALQDFHNHKARTENYVIKSPFAYETRLAAVRKEDGLD